jgi:hypothetical protein
MKYRVYFLLGLVVLLCMAGAVGLVVICRTFVGWFNANQQPRVDTLLSAEFERGVAVTPSMVVREVGFEVGYVKDVTENDDGHLVAEIAIERGSYVTDFFGVFLIVPPDETKPYLVIDALDPDDSPNAKGVSTKRLIGRVAEPWRAKYAQEMRKKSGDSPP